MSMPIFVGPRPNLQSFSAYIRAAPLTGVILIDTLQISDLNIQTRIGVHAWEQRINQLLKIDITIPLDLSACQETLANTLDYADLCAKVTTFVESNSFNLIETVAEKVALFIKSEFNVSQVTICVNKPHAVKNAGAVKVKIER